MTVRRAGTLFSAAAMGSGIGVGLGVMLPDREFLASAVAVALGVLVVILARRIVAPADRKFVIEIVILAYAARVGLAVVLHAASIAMGRGGFITGDDQGYFTLSHYFVLYLQGHPQPPYVPPDWWGNAYLFGTWVYVESAIFYVFGPDLLLALFLNATLMTIVALLAFTLARNLFGPSAGRLSLLLVAFFPSLVLWSALNLKDALSLALILLMLGAMVAFQRHPGWRPFLTMLLLLLLVESLRQYIYVVLTALVPVAVVLSPALRGVSRLRWGVVSSSAALVLIYAVTLGGVSLSPAAVLSAFEGSRSSMAVGARTSFQEPTALPVTQGDTFVVPTASPASIPTTARGPAISASPSPHVVVVPAGAGIVIVTPSAQTPTPSSPLAISPSPEVYVVRPGDVVVIGPPGTTPGPVVGPLETERPESGAPVALVNTSSADAVGARAISYLPRGLLFTLFAPFPWANERALDLLTVPDMLLWYVVMTGAIVTAWRERRQWRTLSSLALFVGGVILILALAEGNIGTLYRHRAMVVPAVAILASPSLVRILALARSR